MNWHRTPELLDRLAAEYALGTLHGGARRRFETVMRIQPNVAAAAMRWHERLTPMAAGLKPLPASDALWSRIEQRAFGGPAVLPVAAPSLAAAAQAWWRRWLAPIPAGAMALGLMLGLVGPGMWSLLNRDQSDGQLPESYIGVLSAANGKQGLLVSSLRRGKAMDLKQVQPAKVPAGQTLFLWTIDAAGVAAAVGPLPTGAFTQAALDRPADEIFAKAVELGVSLEAAGSRPVQPSQPYVYRGLCGKLWRVPTPNPTAR